MKRRYPAVLFLLILSIGLGLSTSCTSEQKPGGAAPPGGDRSSHEAMLALLEDVRRRTPDENRWLGDKRAREFRKHLAELPPESNAQDRWRANLFLGIEELRLGNEKQAIEHLKTAYGVMPPHQHGEEWAYRTTFRVGLAYMRYGETQNCALRHTSESCILPIRGTGVHVDPEGSQEAIRYFTEVLEHAPESSPEYIKTRWLMNIAYMTLGGYPDDVPPRYRIAPEVFESTVEFPRFINIAPDLGLNTFNLFGGVVTDDFNNDGYLDILDHDLNDKLHSILE